MIENVKGRVQGSPELSVGDAERKSDAEGNPTDEATIEELRTFQTAFQVWLDEIAAVA